MRDVTKLWIKSVSSVNYKLNRVPLEATCSLQNLQLKYGNLRISTFITNTYVHYMQIQETGICNNTLFMITLPVYVYFTSKFKLSRIRNCNNPTKCHSVKKLSTITSQVSIGSFIFCCFLHHITWASKQCI